MNGESVTNEQKATGAILTHIMHRMNEFFNQHPAQTFADEQEAGRAFLEWLAKSEKLCVIERRRGGVTKIS